MTCADLPPLEELLKECSAPSGVGNTDTIQNLGKLFITEYFTCMFGYCIDSKLYIRIWGLLQGGLVSLELNKSIQLWHFVVKAFFNLIHVALIQIHTCILNRCSYTQFSSTTVCSQMCSSIDLLSSMLSASVKLFVIGEAKHSRLGLLCF